MKPGHIGDYRLLRRPGEPRTGTGCFAIPQPLRRQPVKIALNLWGQLADLSVDGDAGIPPHRRTRDGVRPSNGTFSGSQPREHDSAQTALFAGAVTTTVQAVERDVVGWEGARWGMNECEIREAFSSKLLVPLAGEQPSETLLSIPGYVFLGCPFDVTFRFAGARGLVRINLTEVGNLLGHHGTGIAGYGAACKLIDRRLRGHVRAGAGQRRREILGLPFGGCHVRWRGCRGRSRHLCAAR